MKAKEFAELKSKKATDLTKMIAEKRVELTKFTTALYAGREKNLKKGKMIKRDIAQMLSVLSFEKKDTTKKGAKV